MELLIETFDDINILSTHNKHHYRNSIILNESNSIASIQSLDILKICNKHNYYDDILVKNDNDNILIEFKTEPDKFNEIIMEIKCKYNIVSCYINGVIKFGEKYLIFNIENYKFSVSPDSFFQVNTEFICVMYNYIYDLCKEINIKNLDCIGDDSGNLCMVIDDLFEKISISVTKSSVLESVYENIKINNKNVKQYNENINYGELLIINPGRKGLKNYVKDFNHQYIIYMSCCPKTLLNDMKLIKKYKIVKNRGFNIFPGSKKYCETINLFELISK